MSYKLIVRYDNGVVETLDHLSPARAHELHHLRMLDKHVIGLRLEER